MTLGQNRIWYKSTDFIEGLSVSMEMLLPDFCESGQIGMTEKGGGLYYLDVNFTQYGTHVGTFYEGGVKKTFKAFEIEEAVGQVGIITKK